MSDSAKHSSLLRYRINYRSKKFYDTGPRREGVIIKLLKAARVPREIENVSRLESQHNEK